MSSFIVWIDTEHAKIFNMSPHGVENFTVKNHDHGRTDHSKFYHEVGEKLKGASEWLLVGPGHGKDEFKKHLSNHHHKNLVEKLLSTESMDHPTDPQILAHARKFFKHAHLFA